MADFSTHPKPALDWFWALVGVYGAGLGTALFVFGRRGMVGWSLLSIVSLTLGAGVIAFGVARQRAEPDAAVTRVIASVGPPGRFLFVGIFTAQHPRAGYIHCKTFQSEYRID